MGVEGSLVLAAIRYTDRYRRVEGAWRFAEREMAFGYYMKLSDLPTGFGDSCASTTRGERIPAELPESLETYRPGTSRSSTGTPLTTCGEGRRLTSLVYRPALG